MCGFSKRGDDNNWIYSTRTISAINDYMTNFPEVFDYMARSGNLSNDMFHHSDVFKAGNGEARYVVYFYFSVMPEIIYVKSFLKNS